jgi:hypothetical protein
VRVIDEGGATARVVVLSFGTPDTSQSALGRMSSKSSGSIGTKPERR